jgi:AhpD family alkylhydroperoxidase
MKRIPIVIASLLLLVAGAASATEPADTYKDIEKTLGLVPTFVKAFPAEGVAAAWADMKGLQLNPNTALPGKIKELMGLAVAAQVPCRYCIFFHTEVAKLYGASQAEISEAVVMASLTRKWSTVANGNQVDEAQFKAELGKIGEYVTQTHDFPWAAQATDAASAYKDMTAMLGVVPSFMKVYPESSIAGAWNEFKNVQMNPKTAIPCKYKELIGLAVASQIPCKYCIIAHTGFARLMGATDEEVKEAVGMAALTRQWSTYLNGMQFDEATFQREARQIINNAKKSAHK